MVQSHLHQPQVPAGAEAAVVVADLDARDSADVLAPEVEDVRVVALEVVCGVLQRHGPRIPLLAEQHDGHVRVRARPADVRRVHRHRKLVLRVLLKRATKRRRALSVAPGWSTGLKARATGQLGGPASELACAPGSQRRARVTKA
eukprot:1182296-Prorocentrum_minimum.AAC.5